jgi:hypothetical protein
MSSLAPLQNALDRAGVEYVVIGAHAVNAWLEPRFTGDFDITVQSDSEALARLQAELEREGYEAASAEGDDLPSGPDFVRFTSADGAVALEIQVAKTQFQREAIARAAQPGEFHVATPEDLIIMKLIANRPKDRVDLSGLVQLPEVDWPYVERWAKQWDVADRLREVRATS